MVYSNQTLHTVLFKSYTYIYTPLYLRGLISLGEAPANANSKNDFMREVPEGRNHFLYYKSEAIASL